MIRARLSDGTFILGIDTENVRRMMAGDPLAVDLTKTGGRDKFIMVYGDTMAEVMVELEKIFGTLPPAQPYDEGHA